MKKVLKVTVVAGIGFLVGAVMAMFACIDLMNYQSQAESCYDDE